MKNINETILIGFLALVTLFSSCDMRDYEVPEIPIPFYQTEKEVITIAAMKSMFPVSDNFGFQIIKNSNKAIKGRVIANDESGNIYKQLYIQDETGAVIIGTNLTGLFPLHRVGQEIIVELDSLNIGKYGGSYQLGSVIPYQSSSGNISIGRMTPREFYTHVFRNGAPQPATVLPTVYTSLPAMNESIRNSLVRFNNVSFENGGSKIFASKGSGYGSANLIIGDKKVLVRTSEYANFAADTIPAGTGSVICILGQFNNTIQLTIRGRKDLIFNN